MSNFHMSDDGPRPCSASKKPCPVGGEHGTQEEIQKSYEAKMNADHAIPTLSNSSSIDKKAFDPKTKYGDSNQVKIRNAMDTFKATEKDAGFEIEAGTSPYTSTAKYDLGNDYFEDGDKETLGFDEADDLRPFVTIESKRNVIWMTPGMEVNGEKRYADTYRYEVSDGQDLKKVFAISQEHVDSLTGVAIEYGEPIANDLSTKESTDARHVGHVKDITPRKF